MKASPPMHGHTPPELFETIEVLPSRTGIVQRVRDFVRTHRAFLFVVILPTAIAGAYLGLVASNQYISEAHFVVRAAGNSQSSSSSLSQLLGASGAMPASQTESLALGDYLTSHDAVATLDKRVGLTRIFQRPGTDFFSRLRGAPEPEALLKFYRNQVDLHYSSETGITTMKVRAFAPDDAYRVATTLLDVGEARVNALNQRAYSDALKVTRAQLVDAETELAEVQSRLTQFRQSERNIDPERSSSAQIELVSGLRAQLAAARAQLASMGGISQAAPQYRIAQRRVSALAAQVAAEDARLTGSNRAMADGLGAFEELKLRQDFAAKRYSAAAAALEGAREQAGRQQLFVVRVVEPNKPVKSLYPNRLWTLATIFGGLLLVYGIGWLIAAGVREHAA